MTGTAEAVDRFNEAFNRHDVDAVMAAMTDDCVFENTSPPNGQRYEGQAQVRAAWEEFFAASPDAHFDGEDVIVAGDRCVVQWVYRGPTTTAAPARCAVSTCCACATARSPRSSPTSRVSQSKRDGASRR